VSRADLNLAHLIDPIDTEEFKRTHWETAPLAIKREEPGYYHDLLTLADVDKVLSLPSPRLRVLRDGVEVPVDSLGHVANPEAVYQQFRNGCTIGLQFLHERIPSLAHLCRSLAAEFSASFQVNAYLTPPNEKGLATHYDTHDVFVLQIAGVKHWRLYEETIRLPLPGQDKDTSPPGQSDLIAEFDLLPGDAIYIPRGFAHDALSVESISLHLTVGVRPITWAFVMLSAIEAAIEQDPCFREALPIGFAADIAARQATETRLSALLDTFRQQVDVERTVDNAVTVARHRIDPSLEGHLLDLESVSQLRLDTRVRRRSTILFGLTVADGKAELSFHGKTLRMPEFVASDLEFIGQADDFTALDLPGVLNESGRLVLIKRLLREGLLTICS
jgi:ribosomal protein L16 Arg81 hydroxylase